MALLLVGVICYYAIGKMQNFILLLVSLIFFFLASGENRLKMFFILFYVVLLTYFGGVFIDRLKGKMKTILTVSIIGLLVWNLFLLKYIYNLGNLALSLLHLDTDISWLQFAAPIGLSYYTLSAIGYLLDIYWKTYTSEKNLKNIALFVCFFPQIISGPVTRFSIMQEQFKKKHILKCDNIIYGLRRMVWGYFKKLVLAERLSIAVQTIYCDYTSASGMALLAATFLYALQLYADFSGCMDIIMGSARLFDIFLPENFHAPFFSRTIPEFWRRWHISLGGWFKDYVMYPLLKTEFFQYIGKRSRKNLGKKCGKRIPTFLAVFIMWCLLGIWHGGMASYFVATALVPYILLLGSEFIQPLGSNLVKLWRVNTKCLSYYLFQRVRTMSLICICWIFVCTNSVWRGVWVLKRIIYDVCMLRMNGFSEEMFGLDTGNICIMLIAILALFVADYMENKGILIWEFLDRQNLLFRWCILWGELFMVGMFGMIGKSSFIYFRF